MQTFEVVRPAFMATIVARGIESLEAPASLEVLSYDDDMFVGTMSPDCELSSFMGIGEAELE